MKIVLLFSVTVLFCSVGQGEDLPTAAKAIEAKAVEQKLSQDAVADFFAEEEESVDEMMNDPKAELARCKGSSQRNEKNADYWMKKYLDYRYLGITEIGTEQ